jgi:hypothetical protein
LKDTVVNLIHCFKGGVREVDVGMELIEEMKRGSEG